MVWYELAVRAGPACPEAWNNLGVSLRALGSTERAAAAYQTALNLRPNFPQVGCLAFLCLSSCPSSELRPKLGQPGIWLSTVCF